MELKIQLPNDLKEYLPSKKQPEYDSSNCEAGNITLVSIDQLEIMLIPTDIDNAEFTINKEIVFGSPSDPHYKEGDVI
jgi:hypothetical protein